MADSLIPTINTNPQTNIVARIALSFGPLLETDKRYIIKTPIREVCSPDTEVRWLREQILKLFLISRGMHEVSPKHMPESTEEIFLLSFSLSTLIIL